MTLESSKSILLATSSRTSNWKREENGDRLAHAPAYEWKQREKRRKKTMPKVQK